MSDGRELDVVLFGATSYVGRLCADYLAKAAPEGARIALAGRSQERLEQVRSALHPRAREWPLLLADTGDPASLRTLAERTTALATTVGPYRRYGLPVVEACAAGGTHYADLTGEVTFIREAIDRFNAVAADSGARVVTSCGFDSIPSDLGVLLLHEEAGAELRDTTLVVRSLKGGASGGTVASLKGVLDDARRDPQLARLVADPYALSPDRDAEPELGSEGDLQWVEHDSELDLWLAPFVMGQINTRVVRRSNAIQDWAYGRELRYREVMGTGSGPLGAAQAGAIAAGFGALAVGLSIGPTRALLDRVLPSPGEGPSESQRERGSFRLEIHTRTSDGSRYVCRVAAKGDPGYKATSVMLGESALCLAFDGHLLPPRAGVLTPASAMGQALVERLRAAGQSFEVERLS